MAGSDADNDGVRDDIEILLLEIDDLNVEERIVLQNMSKIFAHQRDTVSDREKNIESIKKGIEYSYCLEHIMGKEKAYIFMGIMKSKFYNTKERLVNWSLSRENFNGQAIEFDNDESNYESYCGVM